MKALRAENSEGRLRREGLRVEAPLRGGEQCEDRCAPKSGMSVEG